MVLSGGGSQVVLMVAGTTVAPGVSSQSAELLGNNGYMKRRGERVDRVLEIQAAPGEPTSQGLASRYE